MSLFVVDGLVTQAAEWSAPLLEAFGPLRRDVSREYDERYAKARTDANAWLRDAHEMLTAVPKVLRDLHNLDDIEATAKWAAETCQAFNTRAQLADPTEATDKVFSTAITKIVAIDRSDDHVLQSHIADGSREIFRLVFVRWLGAAMGNIAK